MDKMRFKIFLIILILILNVIDVKAQAFIIRSDGSQYISSKVTSPPPSGFSLNQHKNMTDDNEYILSWRKLESPTYRTTFPYGTDSMCVWFQPLGSCSLKCVRIYPITFDGTLVLDIWGSNYHGHLVTPDSVGYIGEWTDIGWLPGKVLRISPLADHIWGSLTFDITPASEPYWREIYPDSTKMVYIGDRDFIIGFYCQKNAVYGTWGIEGEGTVPYHYFQYMPYPEVWGWEISPFSIWIEAVVKYTGDTRPLITNLAHLENQLAMRGPFEITADIVDFNPTGGAAGVREAYLCYTIDEGDTLSVAMTPLSNDTTYVGTIPKLESDEFQIKYWVKAIDINGNENNTYLWHFLGRRAVQAPILIVYDGYPSGWAFDLFNDDYLRALRGDFDPSRRYRYEIWDKQSMKIAPPLSALQHVHTLLWYCGHANVSFTLPTKSDSSYIADFINQGGNFMLQDQEYLESYYATEDSTDIPQGDFFRDYMGIARAYFKFELQETESIAGIVGNVLSGDSIFMDMRLNELTPIGFFSYAYPLLPAEEAEIIFTDHEKRPVGLCVANPKGSQGKTVYLTTHLTFCTPTQPNRRWPEQHDQFLLNILEWFNTPTAVDVSSKKKYLPSNYSLQHNYPNPFNASTTIQYQLSEPSIVRLTIYNIKGQKIKTLVNSKMQSAGFYQSIWDGRDDNGIMLATGVYIYRIEAGGFAAARKLMWMK